MMLLWLFRLFEDGSAIFGPFSFCLFPAWGCGL
jgi:hypothetical protein